MPSQKQLKNFTLDNGFRVVLENVPYRNSISVGIWIPVGSRCENKLEMGYSHFTEHMLFKGTKKRTYHDISSEIDRLGGYMNASTSKEITNYYITISSKFTDTALDVLADIFYSSVIPAKEFNVEKKVILEEIKMSKDNPDDLLFDFFYEDSFGDTPMGRPIAGTTDSISDSTRQRLYTYYQGRYGPDGSVLSLAGNLWDSEKEYSDLKKNIQKKFTQKVDFKGKPSISKVERENLNRKGNIQHYNKDLEQMYFVFGLPGLSAKQEDDSFLKIFTHIMGGTMSSRLFRKLREENGLCYSVATFHSRYAHEGLWGVYCGTSKETFLKAFDLMMEELEKTIQNGITPKELNESKSGLSGSIELVMESLLKKASFNAKSLLLHDELRNWEKRVEKINQVELDSISEKLKALWEKKYYILTSLGSSGSNGMAQKLKESYSAPFLN